jgi:hypothetical protein
MVPNGRAHERGRAARRHRSIAIARAWSMRANSAHPLQVPQPAHPSVPGAAFASSNMITIEHG